MPSERDGVMCSVGGDVMKRGSTRLDTLPWSTDVTGPEPEFFLLKLKNPVPDVEMF